MHLAFLPKTRLGKWSVSLTTACIIMSAAFFLFGEVLDLVPPNLELPFTVLAGSSLVISVASFFIALFAVFLKKERALLIYLPIIVGLTILYFIIGGMFFFTDM